MNSLVILGLMLALAAVAIWLLWRRRGRVRARPGRDGVQEIEIVVRNGYHPDAIFVRRGIPLRVNFNRLEDDACSEKEIFSDFHGEVRLPAFQRTPVEFIPTRSGEFLFTCAFGMYQGRLIVEEPARAKIARYRSRQPTSSVSPPSGGQRV